MKRPHPFLLILVLGLLSAIGPFSIDMYLPGFPAIAKDLHTGVAQVMLSLSGFFVGISVGQMVYGPLLDRFGRKRPLYAGLSLYLLTSLGCAMATSVEMLIAMRVLQALGGCVGMVAARAMVRDLFPVAQNAKIFSLLMLVIAVSPMIAPTLGGYITASVGWQFIFVVLAAVTAAILAAVYFVLPESKQPDPAFSLKPRPIVQNFLAVAREPQFYIYALTGSIAAAGQYAYISGSPYVFMEIFHVNEKQYGWIFAFIAAGLITASQLNTLLLKRFSSEQIVRAALLCQCVTGLVLLACTWAGLAGLTGTIALIFVFLSCQGLTFPNASALSLAPFSRNAGSASALMGTLQMGIGALASALVSILSNHTALPMTGVMAFTALLSCSMAYAGGRHILYRATAAQAEEQTITEIERL